MSKKQKPMVRWRLGSGIGGRGPRELQSKSNEVEEGRAEKKQGIQKILLLLLFYYLL